MLASLCSKFFKLDFSSTRTENFQIYKLGLEKTKKPKIKLPTFDGLWKKQENAPPKSTSAYYVKAFDCVDHNKLWKILQEMGILDHLSCLLGNLYVGQEATELDMEQWTGSKLGKGYVKVVYCHPAYLTYMQSTSCDMPG